MLADGLSGAYTNTINEKTFVDVDKECLQWTYRGIKLCEEIIRFEPDIIGIEECDQLEHMMKYLKPKGYESYYQIKSTSPIGKVAKALSTEYDDEIKMNLDGVAIIYKKNKFNVIGEPQYIDSDNKEKIFGLAVTIYAKALKQNVLFAVTHLKSTKTEQGEQLRERQINLLLKDLIKNDDGLPMVLCCDLNANPIKNKHGYGPRTYISMTTGSNTLNLSSAYNKGNGGEPEFTTYKKRKNGEDKHTIDYIFLKGDGWRVSKLLSIPSDGMIPNWNYPSDHFSIMAQLCWK